MEPLEEQLEPQPSEYPTLRLVARYDATRGSLERLAETLEPVARRWPERPVDPGTLQSSRVVLREAARFTSRLGVRRFLPLHEPARALDVMARLRLATAALDLFRARFHRVDLHSLDPYWLTRDE